MSRDIRSPHVVLLQATSLFQDGIRRCQSEGTFLTTATGIFDAESVGGGLQLQLSDQNPGNYTT